MQQEIINRSLIKMWIYSSFIWLSLAITAGLFIAIKFSYPDFLGGISWLSYGRLRIFHFNTVAFGWWSTSAIGILFYILPRLTGTKIINERLAKITCYIWNLTLILGNFSLLLGYNQGLEVAEFPLFVDILVVIAFIILIYLVFGTIFQRKKNQLYVSLWYIMAGFIWTALNYVVGNFVVPLGLTGANSANVHGFYLHNVVGLWITPIGVAIAYYFLPVSAKTPLYSHKLSLLGFWLITFFYPFTGAHHYIFSPIADWVETIAIVTSICMILPVLTVIINYFGTMKGNWTKLSENIVIKFLITGIIFYALTCLQGPIQSLRFMQKVVHFTDWVVGHSHLAIFGVFTLWNMAAIYYIWPKIFNKDIFSNKLASWHFWLTIIGFSIMALSLWTAGLIQGTMLAFSNVPFINTVAALKPYWALRSIGGSIMIISIFIFMYNILMTEKSSLKEG